MKDIENEYVYKRLFDYRIDIIVYNEPNKAKNNRDYTYFKNS